MVLCEDIPSAFTGLIFMDSEDIFEQAELVALADEELDQTLGAGSPWLFLDYSIEVTQSYSAQISDNAFQFAQGIILPTQVSGDYNNVSVALDLSIYIFNLPSSDALSSFPHMDSLIPFP